MIKPTVPTYVWLRKQTKNSTAGFVFFCKNLLTAYVLIEYCNTIKLIFIKDSSRINKILSPLLIGSAIMSILYYCFLFQIEVFNILFTMISMPDKKHFVYCKDCALEICPTLCKVTVLQQYEMKDLQQIYDSLN